MDERINLLLSYEQNYYNDKEITPFSDRLDTELNQIKNYLDKIRFFLLKSLFTFGLTPSADSLADNFVIFLALPISDFPGL